MKLAERISKPEYLYRPSQLFRRIAQAVCPEPLTVDVDLPWGLRMRARTQEDHGRSLWRLGVYDLIVSEAIWRLLDPGETAIDAGANIGYMTGLMAVRLGSAGRLLAFEPHPRIFAQLLSNITEWQALSIAETTPFALALSSSSGSAYLEEPENFDRNCGTSRLVSDGGSGLRIGTVCLDEVYSEYGNAHLLKLDVEGHELEVLRGGEKVLQARALRDIVFEEHSRSFNCPVALLFAGFGYTVFMLTRNFTGPLLATEHDRHRIVPYLPPNFLATCEPERAISRFRSRRWQVLR